MSPKTQTERIIAERQVDGSVLVLYPDNSVGEYRSTAEATRAIRRRARRTVATDAILVSTIEWQGLLR